MGIIKYSRYYCSKMVTKTEKCSYTEYKIVPGRGSRFISKDGRTHYFISTKARSLEHQKKKSRKTTRIQKAVVGMSIEEIRRKKAESREDRDKANEAYAKDIKDRKAKAIQAKKAKQPAKGQKQAEKAIKQVKGGKAGGKR